MKKVLVVYSGSFNPFHYGHLDILQTLQNTVWIDKVLVVVSPKNPSKPESMYIQSAAERLGVVKKIIEDYGLTKCEASDIEFSRSYPIYTVETLRQIQAQWPDYDIRYVAGADCLEKIQRWRNAPELICDIGMIVFPRDGYDLGEIVNQVLSRWENAKILVSTTTPREISSTEIRRRLKNKEDYFDLTPIRI